MGELQKFALQYGVGLMVIHHNRKQGAVYSVDSILGTSGISGGADTLWIMNKIGEQIRLDIFGKDVDSKTLWLKFAKVNFTWQLLNEGEQINTTPERMQILTLLSSENRLWQTGEMPNVLDKKKNTVSTLLKRMVNEGHLVNPKTGFYSTISDN